MLKHLRIGKLRLIETGKLYGNMNTNKAFYSELLSEEDRKRIYLERRLKVGKDYKFDGHKMFSANQIYRNGSWFEITQDYVDENPNGWTDIPEDILVISNTLPGVVIGHSAADCPVLMAYDIDKQVAAVGHCSGDLINMKMPKYVIDALRDAYDSKASNIVVYISPCAGPSWSYDRYPDWATDYRVWQDSIERDENGLFRIDLRKAISKQLDEEEVRRIIVSPIDTRTDDRFYSHSAYRQGDKNKFGRNFSGCFFEEPVDRQVKVKKI